MKVRMATTVAVATLLGSLGIAGNALGAGYPPEAVRAMGERYEAMAKRYLGAPAPGYSSQALRALDDRWTAIERYYQQAELENARRKATAFDWADAGIGALAAIGAVALFGLGALRIRSHVERSASPAAL
jgi:hypothetical protein